MTTPKNYGESLIDSNFWLDELWDGYIYWRQKARWLMDEGRKLEAIICGIEAMKFKDDYDELQLKAVCCRGCKDAETLFNLHFSDEEINRRAHYRHLTQGGDP